jgi:hypothetical protein
VEIAHKVFHKIMRKLLPYSLVLVWLMVFCAELQRPKFLVGSAVFFDEFKIKQ